jgi:hypothetical protein
MKFSDGSTEVVVQADKLEVYGDDESVVTFEYDSLVCSEYTVSTELELNPITSITDFEKFFTELYHADDVDIECQSAEVTEHSLTLTLVSDMETATVSLTQ